MTGRDGVGWWFVYYCIGDGGSGEERGGKLEAEITKLV